MSQPLRTSASFGVVTGSDILAADPNFGYEIERITVTVSDAAGTVSVFLGSDSAENRLVYAQTAIGQVISLFWFSSSAPKTKKNTALKITTTGVGTTVRVVVEYHKGDFGL